MQYSQAGLGRVDQNVTPVLDGGNPSVSLWESVWRDVA